MKKKIGARTLTVVYLAVVTGTWMFLRVCANSRSRMSEEKLMPVFLTVDGSQAELEVVGNVYDFQMTFAVPENKMYFPLYLASPPELRGILMLLCK